MESRRRGGDFSRQADSPFASGPARSMDTTNNDHDMHDARRHQPHNTTHDGVTAVTDILGSASQHENPIPVAVVPASQHLKRTPPEPLGDGEHQQPPKKQKTTKRASPATVPAANKQWDAMYERLQAFKAVHGVR